MTQFNETDLCFQWRLLRNIGYYFCYICCYCLKTQLSQYLPNAFQLLPEDLIAATNYSSFSMIGFKFTIVLCDRSSQGVKQLTHWNKELV